MANLSPAKFDQYIGNNPEWDNLELNINSEKNALLWNEQGNKIIRTIAPNTKVKLKSNKSKKIKRSECAHVTVNNMSGWMALNVIEKPIKGRANVMKSEQVAMDNLDKLVKSFIPSGPIKICTPMGNFENCVSVRNVDEKVSGREAKADFVIEAVKNGRKIDAIFISHKKAGGAKSFQQYGGLSKQAGTAIQNHPETEEFLRATSGYVVDNKLQAPTYKKVEDTKLIGLSVFGTKFGEKKNGIENVTMVGQGDPILKPKKNEDNCFDLQWSDHVVYNNSEGLRSFTKGDYEAFFAATYRGDRRFEIDGQVFRGARVGIYPKVFVSGRTNATMV